jgi:hypothetical protein
VGEAISAVITDVLLLFQLVKPRTALAFLGRATGLLSATFSYALLLQQLA